MLAQYYRQLHSSFGGGSAAQGGIDGETDGVLPAPLLDPDPPLDW
jgi:hypothetical protein